MKKVSVIIPAYNKAEYTRRTVESVLTQDYPDIEIIVVDDGSTDNTASVMATYGNRINYVLKANGGACSARNEGIRRATGKYVTFLDCDDLFCPQKIKKCVAYLETNPQFGFVYTAAYFIDEDDAITGTYCHPRSREGKIVENLILGNFICNSTVVVRKSVLQQVGLFDEAFFTPADWDMWLRLSEITQAGFLREPLTKYRVVDNYTINHLQQARQEQLCLLEKFFKVRPSRHVLRKRAYSNYYFSFALCDFIKKDFPSFWADCRMSLELSAGNMRTWGVMVLAVLAPGGLRKILEKKILRR